jgi:hypothetical protein
MKQLTQAVLALALCLSPAAHAQVTAVWEDTWGEWVYLPNGLIDGLIQHKRFRVTSGSGYVDIKATLDVTGNSTTTRMWVEEGISYEADLKLDYAGSRAASAGDICHSTTFESTIFSSPGTGNKLADGGPVTFSCPQSVTVSAVDVDDIQVNASDGTFADHVRVTWTGVDGASEYQVFRCTGGDHFGVGGYGHDSVCGSAIAVRNGTTFDDTGGMDETSYWYKIKVCTTSGCGDFSRPDNGYRSDGQDDHGNSCALATSVDGNSTTAGVFENTGNWTKTSSDDVDFFRIDLSSVSSLTVSTTGSNDTSGTLFDSGCNEISESSFGGGGDNFLISEELAEGTYYVGVGGNVGPYDLISSFEHSSALPGPPQEMNATDGSYYDATLVSWSAVQLASSYNVHYSETVSSTRHFYAQTSDTSMFVTGLTSGVVYYFWVYSVNENGISTLAILDWGHAAIRSDATVPDAPVLDAVVAGDGEARLYFTASGDGGTAITGYTASCGAMSQTGPSSPITVSGLTNDSEYSCSVIASNSIGDSAPSNAIAVIPSAGPPPLTMNVGLNDAWYNRATDGQGFFITVFPDIGYVSLSWFTYETERPPGGVTAHLGEPGHRWLLALGTYSGNQAVMDISITSGGVFDTPTEVEEVVDGTIILTFSDCENGTIEYDIPSIDRRGIVPIKRVVGDNIALCETLETQNGTKALHDVKTLSAGIPVVTEDPAPLREMNVGLNDAWFYQVTNGQGFFINVFPDIGYVSLSWFTYETERPPGDVTAHLGEPGHRWLLALGTYSGNQAVMDVSITSGGVFDTPTEVEEVNDGTIILTFTDCENGTIEYDITSINRQGTVPIRRVVGDNIALCETLNQD